ncbi:MAG: hypothetical protein ABS900_07155 [Candidatus Limivicinus sp.]|jgi:hypothetical protein
MSSYEDNQKKVQTIQERGIGILAQNYTVRPMDAGEFANAITSGTQFHMAHYEIEGVGHLMTMYTEGNPHMILATYTLTPYFKKLPMISSDFIYDEDRGMFLIEVYELVKDREDARYQEWIQKYAERFQDIADVEDIPTQPCFYDPIRPVCASKKRTPGRDQDCIQNLVDTLKIFVEQEHASALLDEEEAAEQRAIQHQYVDDLIDQNGVSTRVWVKEHGANYVRRFYHEIFFGV